MKRTTIYLEQAQIEALDDLARAHGVSRAELIRQILNEAIERGQTDPVGEQLAAIEAPFGVLGDDADFVPRGPDDRLRDLERRRLVRVGSGGIPAEYWGLDLPPDPTNSVRAALEEERREGR